MRVVIIVIIIIIIAITASVPLLTESSVNDGDLRFSQGIRQDYSKVIFCLFR